MKSMHAVFAVVLSAALAVGLAACDQTGKPKTESITGKTQGELESNVAKSGQAMEDAAITAKAKVALLKASELKSTDISVETRNGQVTLTGTVPDVSQVQRAAGVVGTIEGVRTVDNKLIVKAPS